MKKILAFLAIIIFVISCKNDVAEKPKNLIEKEQMVDVMYDLSLLSAMRSQNPVMMDSFKNNSNEYIYKKYKIDSTQFAQSNIYYAADYKEYKAMYDQVKLRLDAGKKKIETAIEAEKKKALVLEKESKKKKEKQKTDSIKRVKVEESKIKKTLTKAEKADSIKKAKIKTGKIKMKREMDSLKKIVSEEKNRRNKLN